MVAASASNERERARRLTTSFIHSLKQSTFKHSKSPSVNKAARRACSKSAGACESGDQSARESDRRRALAFTVVLLIQGAATMV
jgi:hypothetical protein